ncbi:hypothetical protein RCL_jg9600.t1 [Rhizophagus clarus]|uniref:Uncharacterized protein n=1 Tax=Rhizophagus clarus TaxID=94130 RepID=A0A8H3M0B4_9GLOM|nr:hypothetical protein RCL_jg9600.t1 [Rhizophagus clarus]
MSSRRKIPNYHELFGEKAINEDFVHDASPYPTNYDDNSRNKKKNLFPFFVNDEEEIPPLDNVLLATE